MKIIGKSLVYIILSILVIPSVSAGSFSESFKNWVLGPEASASVIQSEPVKLDNASNECMQCHNGRDSSHISIKSADSPMQFSASGHQLNHPVGMNYDQYADSQPASYRPRAMLNPSISFANGDVSCISCHEQKSKEEITKQNIDLHTGFTTASVGVISNKDRCTSKKTLTVGPRASDLCMSCHAM